MNYTETSNTLVVECTHCGGSMETYGKDESSRTTISRWVTTHKCTR